MKKKKKLNFFFLSSEKEGGKGGFNCLLNENKCLFINKKRSKIVFLQISSEHQYLKYKYNKR